MGGFREIATVTIYKLTMWTHVYMNENAFDLSGEYSVNSNDTGPRSEQNGFSHMCPNVDKNGSFSLSHNFIRYPWYVVAGARKNRESVARIRETRKEPALLNASCN